MFTKLAPLATLAFAVVSMPPIPRTSGAAIESICGAADNSVPAKCFATGALAESLPLAYARSRLVARMYVNDDHACTGFLIGSEGHVLVAGTSISSAAEAANTKYEFMAESASCNDECKTPFGCKGAVVSTVAELVASAQAPAYSIVKLLASVDLIPYGFLQFRGDGSVLGEQIYVPQFVGHRRRDVFKIRGRFSLCLRP